MLKRKEEVIEWLEKYEIHNYYINDDLTVDILNVDGEVNLNKRFYQSHEVIDELPVQFDIVKGDFIISENNLKTLKGCPRIIYGTFNCSSNLLRTLEGGPEDVQGAYNCSSNQLISLKGSPKMVGKRYGGLFLANDNQLETLEYAPKTVWGDVVIMNNNLKTLKGCPNTIGGIINVSMNNIETFEDVINELKCEGLYYLRNKLEFNDLTTVEEIKKYYNMKHIKQNTDNIKLTSKNKLKI